MTDGTIHQSGEGSQLNRAYAISWARFHCRRQGSAYRESSTCRNVKHTGIWKRRPRLDGPVEVSETTVPITLKLPAGTARLLRAYARSSGLTIGAIVTRALAAFLSAQRRHG